MPGGSGDAGAWGWWSGVGGWRRCLLLLLPLLRGVSRKDAGPAGASVVATVLPVLLLWVLVLLVLREQAAGGRGRSRAMVDCLLSLPAAGGSGRDRGRRGARSAGPPVWPYRGLC